MMANLYAVLGVLIGKNTPRIVLIPKRQALLLQ